MSVFDFFIVTYQITSFYCRKGLELSLNAVWRFIVIQVVYYFECFGNEPTFLKIPKKSSWVNLPFNLHFVLSGRQLH